ncbi:MULTISPECIES: 16S rRNA (adenine(1518)-N(6)/adenine(1519)-N(6))-dimethyltransferase RsmA [unclassified Bartonella]|uniref:16S rRNA (adenine(1518)-N(6)/adenine(1519)-N(6))- dimethyltransferase RsmA n=1 Tax=unclassified Bartonella TaxID=2645622 RepID=UPI0021C9A066|nr:MULTISPECIES: 16S rRNA (adenine(1518)-N(6)/adenine(1519)-N(6))-dimethyltransferase RsmA [unclassified Bartonella]UXN04655.1 16S rRNA (adenine(1518)-N(6)/adenine(1519)-N(6))-dimethyltransferase RsmA [Bartonella sp. HY406]UXN07694.1 16S rRNA (adenine(1518)-N(6)/adenine(1519)-N(6))-dimethyltransferase RsmA [Bartonella sp. HY761]
MAIDNLPPLRDVIETFGLSAKKSLGQNFLFDLNLTTKIAKQAGDLQDKPVLEIGPGPGGLTRALLAQGAIVTAIERDERCLAALDEISRAYPNRLNIIHGDALEIKYTELYSNIEEKPRIIANLPYNVGTQLLINWLLTEPWPPFYHSLTLMFQKEVAQRVVAKANDDHYGRLGVLAGWRTQARIAFDVPPQAFTPPPKVTSSIVHLIPRDEPLTVNVAKLEQVTLAAFGQRRKMLRQSLKSLGGEQLLNKANIDPTRRAETLDIEDFVKLANLI